MKPKHPTEIVLDAGVVCASVPHSTRAPDIATKID